MQEIFSSGVLPAAANGAPVKAPSTAPASAAMFDCECSNKIYPTGGGGMLPIAEAGQTPEEFLPRTRT